MRSSYDPDAAASSIAAAAVAVVVIFLLHLYPCGFSSLFRSRRSRGPVVFSSASFATCTGAFGGPTRILNIGSLYQEILHSLENLVQQWVERPVGTPGTLEESSRAKGCFGTGRSDASHVLEATLLDGGSVGEGLTALERLP